MNSNIRKLTTVKKITKIEPILEQDNIVLINLDNGWKVLANKDKFNVGDYCIYFEYDSIIPEDFEKKVKIPDCYINPYNAQYALVPEDKRSHVKKRQNILQNMMENQFLVLIQYLNNLKNLKQKQ